MSTTADSARIIDWQPNEQGLHQLLELLNMSRSSERQVQQNVMKV